MDDDLRSLAEELERDDPRLAALLDGAPPGRGRRRRWPLLALPLLAMLLLLPVTTAIGVVAVVAILGSPLAACWLAASAEGPRPGRT